MHFKPIQMQPGGWKTLSTVIKKTSCQNKPIQGCNSAYSGQHGGYGDSEPTTWVCYLNASMAFTVFIDLPMLHTGASIIPVYLCSFCFYAGCLCINSACVWGGGGVCMFACLIRLSDQWIRVTGGVSSCYETTTHQEIHLVSIPGLFVRAAVCVFVCHRVNPFEFKLFLTSPLLI